MTNDERRSKTPALMFLGTSSDSGKSIMAAAFCRLLRQRGVRVAPFKAQNMALNSGVTPAGREMGRAQIVQAEAAGIPPHVDMNPVLLKPTSERGSQVIVHGIVAGNMDAAGYYRQKKAFWPAVTASYDRLAAQHAVLVLEGAGSPVEMNLKDKDIVNMAMAGYADAGVVLVADIDRGGVFASIVGTVALLEPSERARIIGFVINKFRGDIALFASGADFIMEKTGLPVLGVLPYLRDLYVPGEDSVALESKKSDPHCYADALRVAVIRLPYIANYTDFDPLECDPRFKMDYITACGNLHGYDVVIVPGSKNICADYAFITDNGLAEQLRVYYAAGGRVLGICGGFQMLGRTVDDPHGVESARQHVSALGLLPVDSVMEELKITERVSCRLSFPGQARAVEASGYEIHMGCTRVAEEAGVQFLAPGDSRRERVGIASADGRIVGTYLHGMFDGDAVRDSFLGWAAGRERCERLAGFSYRAFKERNYDRLAEAVEKHVNVGYILDKIGIAKAEPSGTSE